MGDLQAVCIKTMLAQTYSPSLSQWKAKSKQSINVWAVLSLIKISMDRHSAFPLIDTQAHS